MIVFVSYQITYNQHPPFPIHFSILSSIHLSYSRYRYAYWKWSGMAFNLITIVLPIDPEHGKRNIIHGQLFLSLQKGQIPRPIQVPLRWQWSKEPQCHPLRNQLNKDLQVYHLHLPTKYRLTHSEALMLQFKRLANVYFLIISILMSISIISPINPLTAWAPLIIVIGISMIREGTPHPIQAMKIISGMLLTKNWTMSRWLPWYARARRSISSGVKFW